MTRRVIHLLLGLGSLSLSAQEPALDLQGETVVVYNRDFAQSRELAEFYAQKRSIAKVHLVGLDLPLEDSLSRDDFDRLLRSADLNFVRGEDSLVRALWAGRPFVWHIYPQHDDAHHAKLLAFLDWLQAPASLRAFHLHWNGLTPAGADGLWPDGATLAEWQNTVLAARDRLLAQTDLVGQLRAFVGERRPGGPDTEKH